MTTTKSLFTLAPLHYDIAALEPYISEQTLHYHHDKHLAGYVNRLNELILGTPFEGMTLKQIICQSSGPVFNNAAQVWNHEFYFNQLSPTPRKEPEGMLKAAIEEYYGGIEALKAKMTSDALALFGSGWVWLATDDKGVLCVLSKPNAATPLTEGLTPLLAIDVWEHAYYIDHRNLRADGVKALWEVLDWKIIEERYDAR